MALISCAVTAQLICGFVYAYTKSRFSYDAAHLITVKRNDLLQIINYSEMDAYFLYITSKLEKLRKGPERNLLDIAGEFKSWDLWRAVLAEGIATMLFVFVGTSSIVQPTGELMDGGRIVRVSGDIVHSTASRGTHGRWSYCQGKWGHRP